MGFLKRLFGGHDDKEQEQEYVDKHGIYFYVQCDNCGAGVKVRADKQHDLSHADGGYVWHKTIVDSRCFRPMHTVVHFDGKYNVTSHTLEGGRYITKEEYEALRAAGANRIGGPRPDADQTDEPDPSVGQPTDDETTGP